MRARKGKVLNVKNFNREEQIRQLHANRKKTKEKVEEAIKRLVKSSKVINFNSVAQEAGVNKATLYNHRELKERIDFLRKQGEKDFVDSRIKRNEKNQNAIIASLKQRIEKLKKRTKSWKKKIKTYEKKKATNLLNILLRNYNEVTPNK